MVSPNKNNLGDGYFMLSRSLFSSNVWKTKPAWCLKVWLYLIGRATHTGNSTYRRGECFLTYKEIWEESGLINDGIKPRTIDNCIRWLKSTAQITTRKTTRGFYLTICNYDIYQNSNNYKTTRETTSKTIKPRYSDDTIYKKEIMENINRDIFNFWNSQKIITHREFDKFDSHIAAKLENYTTEEIKEGISNYATILQENKYKLTYKWTLNKFLTRKGVLDTFLTANDPFNFYLKRSSNNFNDPLNGKLVL